MTLNLASNFGYYQNNNKNKETIHSGQFMVSEFEAEEAQEDEETTIDPDSTLNDVNLIQNENSCTDIQLYVPNNTQTLVDGSNVIISSHLEIETSLTKLFKCMNLAYSQKLTSPKWNHFKGVKLRWKDKIRLNNVIWRCWHMQFILKRKTPVCQFDTSTDIHTSLQSVVLEGKYWKRQFNVITAEYRKWRRNFKTKAIGYSPYYNEISEFDFDLSLPEDRFSNDFFLSDAFFSNFNTPFQFPDRREIENITRNANNNADLLQPNLGALQPNIDDIDITFQELLQHSRLPPVPEEGSEELFKSIMGTEQMETGNLIDITNSAQNQILNDLNTPIIENNIDMLNNDPFNNQILNNSHSNDLLDSVNSVMNINNFPIVNPNSISTTENNLNHGTGFPTKNNVIKGRVSKSNNRTFRKREPHNYDKAQPTLHQTSIYQQMLAEQQQNQQQQHQISLFNFNNQQQQQMYSSNNFLQQSPPHNNNLNNGTILKSYSIPQSAIPIQVSKVNSPSEILSIINYNNALIQQQDVQQNYTTNLRKSSSTDYINVGTVNCQPDQQTNSLNFLNVIQQNPPIIDVNSLNKEMTRSNSLPLNTSFQKWDVNKNNENFVVPKYQAAKGNRVRSRSYSIQNQQNQTYIQQPKPNLQTAISDPMLNSNNSTLAQLLATNSAMSSNKNNSNSSAISYNLPSGFSSSNLVNTPTNYQTAQLNNTNNNKSNNNNVNNNNNNSNNNNNNNKNISNKNINNNSINKTFNCAVKSISLPQNLQLNSPQSQKVSNFTPNNSTQNLSLSPESFISDHDSQMSPSKSATAAASNTNYPRDTQRRAGHIHAEQKRRYNIKNGFDVLHSLIPQLQQNPNAKLSKAAMLQKGAEYIKQLRAERNLLNDKMDSLRKERENLNNSLSHLHSVLPANGAHTVTRQRTERIRQLYNQYIRYKTMENWKYWILGLILEPLLNSYTNTVSITSIEELHRTALHWVDQHCSLIELRPAVSNKLRYLSMTTDILSDPPSTLEEEVLKAVNNGNDQHPNLNSS